MRHLLLFFCFLSLSSKAQLYSNGSLSTGSVTASNFAAPSGYTWSELQINTGNTTQANSTAGLPGYYYNDGSISYALADDFTVPAGQTWQVTSFDFFLYKPVYSGTTPPIDQLKIRLYNTDPSLGGATPIAGNFTVNVYDSSNSQNAFIYRIFHSLYPTPQQPNFIRKVFSVRGTLNATLPSGNYWVEYQAHASDDTEVFFPPVTVVGSRAVPLANSKINVIASIFPNDVLGWGNIIDIGIPNSAPDVALAVPFVINGNLLDNNEYPFVENILLYPNPVSNQLFIANNSQITIESIELFDINSRKIQSELINDNRTSIEINVNELVDGIYFLKINSERGIITKKFSKN